jgi:hypothetical protein
MMRDLVSGRGCAYPNGAGNAVMQVPVCLRNPFRFSFSLLIEVKNSQVLDSGAAARARADEMSRMVCTAGPHHLR